MAVAVAVAVTVVVAAAAGDRIQQDSRATFNERATTALRCGATLH